MVAPERAYNAATAWLHGPRSRAFFLPVIYDNLINLSGIKFDTTCGCCDCKQCGAIFATSR